MKFPKGRLKRVQIGELLIDEKLKEIRHVSDVTVSQYRQDYRNGADMPPLVVDKANRVVSGNHRLTALLKEYNADYEVDVRVINFKSEIEVLKFFTADNLKHGRQFDGFTKRKICESLMDLGEPIHSVAKLFGRPVKRVEIWCGIRMAVIGGEGEVTHRPAKRGMPTDKEVSKDVYDGEAKKAMGVSCSHLANQLSRFVRNELISYDSKNLEALSELYHTLGRCDMLMNYMMGEKSA